MTQVLHVDSVGVIMPLDCTWAPLPDITAFELASLLPFLMHGSRGLYQADWEALGAATRHLKRNDQPEASRG